MSFAKKTAKYRRTAALVLTAAILCCQSTVFAQNSDTSLAANGQSNENEKVVFEAKMPYTDYLELYKDKPTAKQEIKISLKDSTASEGVELKTQYEGKTGDLLYTGETGFVEFEVTIPETGMYIFEAEYIQVEGKGMAMEREVSIDGEVPFAEAASVVFDRLWKDSQSVRDTVDTNGNEIRPEQVEAPQWTTTFFQDGSGYYTEPLQFCIEKGVHTIRLTSVREAMVLGSLTLKGYEAPPSYAEYIDQYKNLSTSGTAKIETIQAELPILKSDPMLFPVFDRSSPYSQPKSTDKILLNSIGGDKWKVPGQWLEWEVEVPADGLYKIALRSRQNVTSGFFASRVLYINGEIPFAEAQNLQFNYTTDWQMYVPGSGEEEFYVYLEEGKTNTIRLEAAMGEMRPYYEAVNASLLRLNEYYRQILMITGSSPDTYRDYGFEKEIPEVVKALGEEAKVLEEIRDSLLEMMGDTGEMMSIFDTLIRQLKELSAKPRTIASRFSSFQGNISSLGTWLLTVRDQPLQIDYIVVAEPSCELEKAEAGFFEKLIYEIQMFIASFFSDYNSIGAGDGDSTNITVWTTAPRDQTNIMRQMIDSDYNGKIGVTLQMVAGGTLLPSVLAGKGPDVALGQTSADVMNYAARGALSSLSGYADLETVQDRFMESATIPLQYNGETYALPETQSFPILFYRKDILAELGLSLPKTWDDVYAMLPYLQKQNMTFGLPGGMSSFTMFLYQMGGQFYNDEGTACALDSDISIDAFRTQTEYFTNYKLNIEYDFANRFRTGEMPVGIADYTTFNQLSVFAPEIKGLWGFAVLPGTVQEDGSVNNSATSGVTGCVVMAAAENKDACWEFIKWWTDTDAQIRYGREQESLLGAASRYNSANVEALKGSQWTADEIAVLEEQWNNTIGIPEVPGGYYVSRYIDFAFRGVVVSNQNPRETMMQYVDTINKEIEHKRLEFGLTD